MPEMMRAQFRPLRNIKYTGRIIPFMASPSHLFQYAPVICIIALLVVQVSAAVGDPTPGDPSVTRGESFTTTISGPSYTSAYVWVHGTSGLSGAPGDQPPVLAAGQDGVVQDPPGGPYTVGSYQYSGGGGRTLRNDVPSSPDAGTRYYARVDIGGSGSVTVGWVTSINTKTGGYDIRVERSSGGSVRTDDVLVTVTEGEVTAEAPGTITAYIGGELVLTGVNTETGTTYLFITGPNLPASGGRLDRPEVAVVDGNPSTFTQAQVGGLGVWQYTWGIPVIDPGTYTVFAESDPRSFQNLGSTTYNTIPVVLGASSVTGTTPSITTTTSTVPPTASPTTIPATATPSQTTPVPTSTRAGAFVPASAIAGTVLAGWLIGTRRNR